LGPGALGGVVSINTDSAELIGPSIGLRRIAGVLGALVALAILSVGTAGMAAAHPTLLFTDPAADTAVPFAPQSITLVFNEPVSIGAAAIVLLDSDGKAIPLGAATDRRAPPANSMGRHWRNIRTERQPPSAGLTRSGSRVGLCGDARPALRYINFR
jgi:CopC domain